MVAQRAFIAGVWDLFHVGHLNALQTIAELGYYLIAGVVTDESALEYKGHLPIIPFEQRSKIIGALACVDEVVIVPEQFSIAQMEDLQVDVVWIGRDWCDKRKKPPLLIALENHQQVIYLPRTEGIDSATIKQKIRGRSA